MGGHVGCDKSSHGSRSHPKPIKTTCIPKSIAVMAEASLTCCFSPSFLVFCPPTQKWTHILVTLHSAAQKMAVPKKTATQGRHASKIGHLRCTRILISSCRATGQLWPSSQRAPNNTRHGDTETPEMGHKSNNGSESNKVPNEYGRHGDCNRSHGAGGPVLPATHPKESGKICDMNIDSHHKDARGTNLMSRPFSKQWHKLESAYTNCLSRLSTRIRVIGLPMPMPMDPPLRGH